jgi:hypothetical protein
MHAVVVKVNVSDPDASLNVLREQVVPRVKQAPGFVTGYWTREGSSGLSMVVFDSQSDAQGAADMVPSLIPDGVTLESVDVREVVAHA